VASGSTAERTVGERPAPPDGAADIVARRSLMALCAAASRVELEAAVSRTSYHGHIDELRRPETGLVMVRGRVGGEGAPFNLGEATVSRATVRIDGGAVGFAYHLGRDQAKARLAAILDALAQSPDHRSAVDAAVADIRARIDTERLKSRRQTAATRVNFFTLVRGED
jgi:alpha-D-ribose 1-methylphosphonate 5-triphosphate synthase subunit PhnG